MNRCVSVRHTIRALALALIALAAPAAAFAQASIAGVVKDSSGGVLPGVTVEASSPALIEKTRSVITDAAGQYKIVDLLPGTYSVAFSLSGFSTIKRDGIELAGSFTATINVDMKVGNVSETINVTAETPIVDIQSVKSERVLSKEVIDAIPTNKNYQTLMALIPGMGGPIAGVGNGQDVGGSSGEAQIQFSIHGTRGNDQRFTVNGVPFEEGNGSTHALGMNVVAMQEMAIGTAAADATLGQGGVRLNYVPRSGGNSFSGGAFFSATGHSLQSNNITSDLKTRGLPDVNYTNKLWDVAPTFGGPIVKDRLWFFASYRRQVAENVLAGRYANAFNGDPTKFTYSAVLSQQMTGGTQGRWAGGRLTWQANAKNKIGFSYDANTNCLCANQGGTYSPEAGRKDIFDPMHYWTVDWTAPVTSRLLLEASMINHPGGFNVYTADSAVPGLIQITDLAPPASYFGVTQYRGSQNQTINKFPTFNSRFSASYVTGAHSVNVGGSFGNGQNYAATYRDQSVSYNFRNGLPSQIVQYAFDQNSPVISDARLDAEVGIWAQDRYTINRLTLNGALRFDYLKTSVAAVNYGPTTWFPTRNFTFPAQDLISWKDITPRVGAVYDLFGNGKTAVRASLNKYVVNQGAGGPGNNQTNYVNNVTRNWTDNGNFIPDCNLANFSAQDNRATGGDLCGAINNANFGNSVTGTVINPAINQGWNKRGYNWEFSTGVQQQILPRVGIDVSYFRRWYGNFQVTDNTALSTADYETFFVTVPNDPRLPNAGQVIGPFVNVTPSKFTVAPTNYQTFASDYGTQYEHWNGVDVNVSARLRSGVFLQGGTSTGRTSTDNCAIQSAVPESTISAAAAPANTVGAAGTQAWCHVDTAWLTQIKGLGSYTVPKIDVQVSATYQNRPGPDRQALVNITSAQTTLGHAFAGGASTLLVNVVPPNTLFGERVNQIDLRLGKLIRIQRTRANVSVDLYNVTNNNAVLAESNSFSNWLTPTAVVPGRLLKFTAQFDF